MLVSYEYIDPSLDHMYIVIYDIQHPFRDPLEECHGFGSERTQNGSCLDKIDFAILFVNIYLCIQILGNVLLYLVKNLQFTCICQG